MKYVLRQSARFFLAGICVTLLCSALSAQSLRFEHISSREGLPQRTVTCVMQDSRGFIWAGTQEGLCRYDGTHVMVYRQNSGGTPALSDDYVWCLLEDSRGILWVGTRHGLTRFDPVEQLWKRYFHTPSDAGSLSNDWVTDLYEDEHGTLWVTTLDGLNRMQDDGTFQRIALPGKSRTDSLWCLTGDGKGTLWIGSAGRGLYALETAARKTTVYRGTETDLPSDDVRALAFDGTGKLWIGTSRGCAVRGADGRVTVLASPTAEALVAALEADGDGGMWVGMYGDGVEHWSAPSTLAARFRHNDAVPASLSNNRVTSLHRDASGNIWVGTFNGGLNRCNPLADQFHHLREIGGPRATPDDRMVWGITTDLLGTMWIATDNGIHLRAPDASWRRIGNRAGDIAPISHSRVWCLLTDSKGVVWAGTRAGLNRYAVDAGSVRRLPPPPAALQRARVFALLESSDGLIWAGTEEGLYAYDPLRNTLRRYLDSVHTTAGVSAVQPWCMLEGKNDTMWVGTNGDGLFSLNPADGSSTRYEQKPGGLGSSSITCMQMSEDGAIWLGTIGGGLHRFDPRDMHMTRVTEVDGLSNNTIYGMLRDTEGRFWMSSNRGLSIYNSRSREVRNFEVDDGLQAEEFNQGAYALLRDGIMVFGGGNGINMFDPSEIRLNTHPPSVVITSLRAITPGSHGEALHWTGRPGDVIELPYDQNFITLTFAALEFSDSDCNAYSWKLVGLHDGWMDTTQTRSAMFTGLPPGSYTFMVRASNNHGVWNEKGVEVSFIIHPPWWATWWFRVLLLAALIGAVLFIFRSRLRAVQRRSAMLEEQVRQRTAELKQRSEELQGKNTALEEALDALRSTQSKLTYASKMASLGQMTAGIAHEIKNPINFVNNFAFSSVDIADELQEELEKGDTAEGALADRIAPLIDELVTNAQKISEHGARVDRIVQSMLLHSHGKVGEAEPVPLNEFLDQYVTLAFHGMRAQVQDFTVTIEREYDDAIRAVPLIRQDVARVFVNLLNNAFQAVNDRNQGGEPGFDPVVRVRTTLKDDRAVIVIEDNGNGVPERLREKIFEPFFTTKAAGSGTGLGLSLSYEIIVDGHRGELHYETSALGGACFVIALPLK